MSKIGRKVAEWVDNQAKLAEEIGINTASVSVFLTGKRQLPLNRFIQIVHARNPPQQDVDEIFNLYLEDLGIPDNALKLQQANAPQAPEGSVLRDARIAKITELVMASEDIDPAAKVAVYNIIQSTRKK